MKYLKHLKLKDLKSLVISNKILSGVTVISLVLGAYGSYKHPAGAGETRYIVMNARLGNIESSVSGTGYVSSENQIDIKAKVSGDITRVNVKPGDRVTAGQVIAEVDDRDALLALQNQQIAYAKLTEPAKVSDLQAAKDNVAKAYSDAWNAISSAYLTMPGVITGLDNLIYGQTGYLNEQGLRSLSQDAIDYRETAGLGYDKTNSLYEKNISLDKSLTRSSPKADIENLLEVTYSMISQAADTLKNTRNAISFISQSYPIYNTGGLSPASANVNAWSSDINSSLSSLLSAENAIASSEKSLSDLQGGADSLDVESAALSLRQKQNSYDDYFVKAPYDGVIAKVGVSVGSSASGATVATIVSDNKFADIPLNEIDAANVKPGDKVNITFDAVPGLTVQGAVEEADLIGTVSQGVVTYNVRVSFAADGRVKPGMSTSADIITNEKDNVVVIPASAVKARGKESYVEIFSPALSGTKQELLTGVPSPIPPKQVNVTLGVTNDTEVEVTQGLNDGDQVVLRTVTATAAAPTTTTAPSLFGGGGGNVRVGGGAGGSVRRAQ